MKKNLEGLIKLVKNVSVFKPSDVRLSFYIVPMGDVTNNMLTAQDLINISNFEKSDDVNTDLFDNTSLVDDGNILALLDEGVIEGVATGADLGIYDYDIVENKPIFDYYQSNNWHEVPINSDYENITYFDNDNNEFDRCCFLAEESPLGINCSKIVYTFTGHLEVKKEDYSIIRCFDCDKSEIKQVYISKDYINRYQLRHGDEIMCTCKKDNGKMVLDSLFNINQIPRRKWDTVRSWFSNIKSIKPEPIICDNIYMKEIINKFGLFNGDNAFVYLTKKSQKQVVLAQLVKGISSYFDKIIYINPNYIQNSLIEDNNIVKFVSVIDDKPNIKITTILLATQYAKRMVELGKKVALFIDDIKSITELDKAYNNENLIIGNIYGTTKVCSNGCCNTFSFVSLRNSSIQSLDISPICQSVETLGIVVDEDAIDLFNSYRI
jgi:hypothetical protein